MRTNSDMVRRLQIALNSKNMKILFNRSQFYSEQQKRPITMYKISQSRTDSNGKNRHIELFSSASEIQIVLFLRNLWNAVNGKPIPPTNKIKGAEYFETQWENFVNTELDSVLELSNTCTHNEDENE